MNCENYWCIYQEKGQCTLEKIELDIIGSCKKCIYVDIESEKLEERKQEMRKRL